MKKVLFLLKVLIRALKRTAAELVGMPVGFRRGLAVPQRQPLADEFWGRAATPEASSWPNQSALVKKVLFLLKLLVRAFRRTAAESVRMPVGLRRGLAVPRSCKKRRPAAASYGSLRDREAKRVFKRAGNDLN